MGSALTCECDCGNKSQEFEKMMPPYAADDQSYVKLRESKICEKQMPSKSLQSSRTSSVIQPTRQRFMTERRSREQDESELHTRMMRHNSLGRYN